MSDSWTDNSGIDGNYDEDSENNEHRDTHESSEERDTNEQSDTRDLRNINNIRDVWNARTCYVSDELADDLDKAWLEMQTKLVDSDHTVKKNRHFYPIVLQLGIESLRDADSETIEDLISP